MALKNKFSSTINIHIDFPGRNSAGIPKLIRLFDHSLNIIQEFWIQENNSRISDLVGGLYVVRLFLSSGFQKDIILAFEDGETKDIFFDLNSYSLYGSGEWAYLNKLKFSNIPGEYEGLPVGNTIREINGNLWTYRNNKWEKNILSEMTNYTITSSGRHFELDLESVNSILEINGPDIQTLFVCLPPYFNVKIFLSLSEKSDQISHPISVTISTDNLRIETLLTLITRGAILEAKKLTNSQEAENLLQRKRENPTAAAVGGYYLLKVGDLDRLHDWANNLANWFEWMPDGAIIHAWQIMANKNKNNEDIQKIRKRLLESLQRGIPIFTEGLRLLHNGLNQLYFYYNQSDEEVNAALTSIKRIVIGVDWTKETTTFIMNSESNSDNEDFFKIDPENNSLVNISAAKFGQFYEEEIFGEKRNREFC